MFGEIVEKEIPLGYAPQIGVLMIIETNHERGDEVELSFEIGQGDERLNPPDGALNAKQFRHVGEHRHVGDVQAHHVVTEQLRDVGEVTGATTEIENASWRPKVEIEPANAANVDVDPAVKIEILRPIFAGIIDCIGLANMLELFALDRLHYSIALERKSTCAPGWQMTPCAFEGLAGYEFFELATKLHGRIHRTYWQG